MPLATMAEATLTMRPPPCARMTGTTARAQFQTPLTLTAITRSHSASGIASKGCGLSVAKTAALLTSTSMRPKRATAASTIALHGGDVADVGAHAEHAVRRAELLRRRHRIGDVGHDHARALGQEAPRVGEADARRPAGDHGDLVGEPHGADAYGLRITRVAAVPVFLPCHSAQLERLVDLRRAGSCARRPSTAGTCPSCAPGSRARPA